MEKKGKRKTTSWNESYRSDTNESEFFECRFEFLRIFLRTFIYVDVCFYCKNFAVSIRKLS